MTQILLATFILSAVHAAIPSHWLLITAISGARNWDSNKTIRFALLAGLMHTAGTSLIGFLLGFAGLRLSETVESFGNILPYILIAFGAFYALSGILGRHSHSSNPSWISDIENHPDSHVYAFVLTFMFLSPCLEVEAFFLYAGALGYGAVVAVALIYMSVTIAGLTLFAWISTRWFIKIKEGLIDKYERVFTGMVLIISGVFLALV